MPGLAVIATQLTTPDSKPYRLFVANDDILTGTTDGVPLDSLEWEFSGSNSPAALRATHWDPLRAFNMPGHSEVRLWSAANGDEFGGYLIAREYNPAFATGRTVALRATDWSLELDKNLVTGISYPAGLSDRAIIQGLMGNFMVGTISANAFEGATTFIALTNNAMPAMTFEIQSLRSAIEQVQVAANDDGLGERCHYVDAQRRLRYWKSPSAGTAPYVITDGVPSGGQKNVSDLELVYDDSDIVTAVFVKGGGPNGTGLVTTAVDGAMAKYGWRAVVLDVPASKSFAGKQAYGRSYMRTHAAPVSRGSFSITGTTGWKADQLVTITSTNLGLAAATFDIKHVSVEVVTGTPTFRHTIEFGARRPGKQYPRGTHSGSGGGRPIGTVWGG